MKCEHDTRTAELPALQHEAAKRGRGRPKSERANMGGTGPARVRFTYTEHDGRPAEPLLFDSESQPLRLLAQWARSRVIPDTLRIERKTAAGWVGA